MSDEDPTTKDRGFIMLDTYKPSNEDSNSEDNSKDADNKLITEDRAFIIPNIYKSSSKDNNSDDEIDKESTHIGYIEGNKTFILLVRYKDLILKLSLKLYILCKHIIKQLARLLRLRYSEKALSVLYL